MICIIFAGNVWEHVPQIIMVDFVLSLLEAQVTSLTAIRPFNNLNVLRLFFEKKLECDNQFNGIVIYISGKSFPAIYFLLHIS